MKNFIQMNYLKKFTLAMLFLAIPFITVSCNDDDDDMGGTDEKNIVQIAQDTPELSTLVDALVAANLTGALSGDGPFTVFAPTNAAFQKLDPTTLNTIISTPSLLTALLQYHVVADEVFSNELSNGNVPTLLSGQSVAVNVSGGMVTLNGSSKVTTADVMASNGIIHIIDKVLMPPSVVDIAMYSSDFSSLVSAVVKADLAGTLSGDGPFTVFAPTNDAFQALLDSNEDWSSLADIPVATLEAVLNYHVVNGANVQSGQLSNDQEVTALGGNFTIQIGDDVKINGVNSSATVILTDVQGSNGVVHVIDTVLLP